MKNSKLKNRLGLCLPVLLHFACCIFNAAAADRITATVTVTNAPTTNGMTFIVNASTRTWTNSVVTPSSQVLTNAGIAGSTTNLYNHLLSTPPASVVPFMTASNIIRLDARTGTPLSVSGAGFYFSVTYSTQTVANPSADVVVPYTAIPSSERPRYTGGLVDWLNLSGTNSFYENSTSVANLLGNTNFQTVVGIKIFTNVLGQWFGIISNSPAISGNFVTVSNGIWWTGKLVNPISTNGANYGNAFRSPGTGIDSDQFGSGAVAGGDFSMAIGFNANSSGENSLAIGNTAGAGGDNSVSIGNISESLGNSSVALGVNTFADADNSVALGAAATVDPAHTGSVAIGTLAATTKANQIVLGSASHVVTVAGYFENARFLGTNNFPAQSDIAFGRFPVTSLANGNNAAMPVGTNVFIEVSGPSAAFTINGINAAGAQRDGKLLVILNQTTFNMTIAHESGTDPTAANRIVTMTGADRATTGNGTATLMYSGAASRWILIGFDP